MGTGASRGDGNAMTGILPYLARGERAGGEGGINALPGERNAFCGKCWRKA